MYQLGYRCDVTGATLTRPLPKRTSFLHDSQIMAYTQRAFPGNAVSQMMSVTAQLERNSLITGYRPSKSSLPVRGAQLIK
jgi:hypothetical protein